MTANESAEVAKLSGGPLAYTLRTSTRARGTRVVIHPERGVVVTVPVRGTRSGNAGDADRRAVAFLAEREAWLRRHLASQAEMQARIAARGGARDGGCVPYLGELHLVVVEAGSADLRRSSVTRSGDTDGDRLIITRASRERRGDATILELWLRDRAKHAIDAAVDRHAAALRVEPTRVTLRDPRSRWGSASRTGGLSLSWRLVLAPPEALETVVVHELAHLRFFGHGPRFWALVASRRPDHAIWRRWLHDHAMELHGALGN